MTDPDQPLTYRSYHQGSAPSYAGVMEMGADDDADIGAPSAGIAYHRRRRPLLWSFILLVLAALGTALYFVFWFLEQANPPGKPGPAVTVELPAAPASATLAQRLEREGVVTSATAFEWYLGMRSAGDVKAGEYTFHRRASFDDVLAVLRNGPKVVAYTFTIPEGFTLEQVAARVEKHVPGVTVADFRAVAASGAVRSAFQPPEVKSLEGFLFPDTYTFGKGTTTKDVLERMVRHFDDEARLAGLDKVPNVTPYHALVVASMIEREGNQPDDLPKIARVIYNRLNKNMALQIDATLLYGQPPGTKVNTKLESPYNTYKHKGLPPTPICNPGFPAMNAAAHPEAGPWVFYVLVNKDGHHGFTDNYEEFLRMKNDAKARGVF